MAAKSDAAKGRLAADVTIAASLTGSEDRSDRLAAASDLELKLEYLAAEARRRRWRTVTFWSLLAGVPAMALAAFIVTMGERAKAAMEEALARDSAPLIARLEQRGRAAEAMLQGLLQRGAEAEAAIGRQRQMADLARPRIDQLQQEAASSRGELARLNSELAALSQAYAPRLARLDRQQADAVPRLEALGKNAESDRAEIKRLQSQVATISQTQAPLAAEMRKQGAELGTRIDRLLQETVRDRTELARLKAQVIGSSLSQQTGLIDEVTTLRQEVLANRTGLSRLEGAVDAIKQASSGAKPPTELDTAAMALGGPGSETPQAPPASRSPRVAALPADAALPKAASPRQATQNPKRRADATVGPAAPAADDAVPALSAGLSPIGPPGCTRFKTYDAQTHTYRSRGGVIKSCRRT
jgi:DNA repair exonuclease SbcCD ATPase subunit